MPNKKWLMHSLPGSDDIICHTLKNGIKLLTRVNFNSPTVVFKGYLPAGSLSDPDNLLGLASFTAAALMTGTRQHDFQSLYNTIESLGANLGFSGNTLFSNFSGQCLEEDLPTLLQLTAEALKDPVFPAKQFNRLKAQFLTMLAIRAQDTAEMAAMAFDKLIFKGHPYQNPNDGYLETVQAIEINHLEAFHQQHYGPQGMVIAIVGATEPEETITIVENSLGEWTNSQQLAAPSIPALQPLTSPVYEHINIPGKSQTDLVMGTVGPNRLAEDYLACSLGNNILGQFGMMGRIGEAVREKAGLAYYAQSELNAGIGPGTWEVVAGVNPTNLEKTIQLIKDEIERFINEPVTPEELSDTQSFMIGHLPLSLESNSGVAVSLLNLDRFNLGMDYLRQFSSKVEAITQEEILKASRKYLSLDRLAIASAGTK